MKVHTSIVVLVVFAVASVNSKNLEAAKPAACCSNQFECTVNKRCIPLNQKCNYINNCEEQEDEKDSLCKERCYTKYTKYQSAGGVGGGNVWYLDRQKGSCNGKDVMQSLQLERSGKNQQRYKMRCCTWNGNLPTTRRTKHTSWTRPKDITGLTGQHIICDGKGEFLHSFIIYGKWQKKNWHSLRKSFYIKYQYTCDKVISKSLKMNERSSFTRAASQGNKKTQILDTLDINCARVDKFGPRWFLTQFKLYQKRGQVMYGFSCGKMVDKNA